MQNNAETQYLNIAQNILNNGIKREDRTGTGTLSLFGQTIKHDYSEGFPLLTTKKMFTKGIIGELLWFLKGTEDASFLIDNNIKIWDEWMQEDEKKNKVLPHTYGVKWRNFDGVDQVKNVIEQIKNNPYSRRHIVSAWDPRNIKSTALPWCHMLFQFYVVLDKDKSSNKHLDDGCKGDLSIAVVQRSADWMLGVPFNIASYSFLLYMIGKLTNLRPKEMHYTFHDSHIYNNHIKQIETQLSRKPYELPSLNIKKRNSIDDFEISDFSIVDYKSHNKIVGKVSV